MNVRTLRIFFIVAAWVNIVFGLLVCAAGIECHRWDCVVNGAFFFAFGVFFCGTLVKCLIPK